MSSQEEASFNGESDLSDVSSGLGAEDELASSDGEEAYRLEDPDEIDDDLELRDDDDDETPPAKPRGRTATAVPRQVAAKPKPARETRKRKMTYYEEEEEEEEEEEKEEAPKGGAARRSRAPVRPAPQELDADLILTDEETEYNPHAHPDPAKMTNRQRARVEYGGDDLHLEELAPKRAPAAKTKESEHETALRKAETNRRRLDYKNKQLEEEKRDTLNKLLKRRANKTRENPKGDDEEEAERSTAKPRRPEFTHPAMARWVCRADGLRLGVAGAHAP
jgi:Ino eighty subunit 2